MIDWKECASLPTEMDEGQATVIGNKVYFGGGAGNNHQDDYLVHCYDLSRNAWTTLPPLPNWYYAIGQVNNKLTAIGGVKDRVGGRSNEMYIYSEQSQRWKLQVPRPIARDCMGVLSHQSALIVVGGEYRLRFATNVVEIFRLDTLQWCRTDPIPVECCSISIVAIGNICYAI